MHLAALKKLPEIIGESIEAEVHPDYTKQNGERNADSDVNSKSLVHRFYGAANIEGIPYRVKTTMREYADANMSTVAHSYEVTQIELLEAPSDNILSTAEPLAMTSSSVINATKLLQGVEKSYDNGKKLLEESRKEDERAFREYGYYENAGRGEVSEPELAYQSDQKQRKLQKTAADFEATRDCAIAQRGIVMPSLNDATVRVVEVPRHPCSGDRPIVQAKAWAKANIVGEHEFTDSRGAYSRM